MLGMIIIYAIIFIAIFYFLAAAKAVAYERKRIITEKAFAKYLEQRFYFTPEAYFYNPNHNPNNGFIEPYHNDPYPIGSY